MYSGNILQFKKNFSVEYKPQCDICAAAAHTEHFDRHRQLKRDILAIANGRVCKFSGHPKRNYRWAKEIFWGASPVSKETSKHIFLKYSPRKQNLSKGENVTCHHRQTFNVVNSCLLYVIEGQCDHIIEM